MSRFDRSRHHWVGAAGAIAVALVAGPAEGQQTAARHYDLASQPLGNALRAVALASRTNVIVASTLVDGKIAPALSGLLTPVEAVSALLRGSGLRSVVVNGAIVIRPLAVGDTDPARSEPSPAEVIVTGSRIRGAAIASPVIKLSAEDIRNAGQATLAEAVRTLPQNFGGGQNPGIGFNVPSGNGVNVGSASSINLRGIGSDATLTLLNGHRLSYSASRQAIDVSSIPLDAIARIEIVPDGASALYGSDAVAGVANIVLKPDFAGVETSARLGTSTEGGDFEQRYGVVAGNRWSSGGFIAAYEFGRTTPILGSDRSYAATQPSLTLLPGIRQHSVTVSAHQSMASNLELDVDALYNNRVSQTQYSLSPTGDITVSGGRTTYNAQSFVVAPTLRLALGKTWRMFLTGSYGQDHTHYDVTSYSAGRVTDTPDNCYCNDAKSVELGGDGTLFRLPGGPVKAALGAGYRSNDLIRFNGVGPPRRTGRTTIR